MEQNAYPENSEPLKLPPLQILYFTDPLCCWSWAFEPVWQRFLDEYGDQVSWRYCMGGMLSSWDDYYDEVRSINRPAQMGPLWMEVKHLTGVSIDGRIWIGDPPASSYPACVAVKTAELQSQAAAAAYLFQLRKAVMTGRQNIAKKEVLLSIAADTARDHPGFDLSLFTRQLAGDQSTTAFRKDLDETRLMGIKRFPSLVITAANGQGKLLLTGYRPYENLLQAISKFTERRNAQAPA